MRRNEVLAAVVEELREVGVVPAYSEGGKHLQVRWQSRTGQPRFLTVPITPSDHRSILNARADVRRMLKRDGYLIDGDPVLRPPPRELSRIERLEQRVTLLEQKLAKGGTNDAA
jgi:hypothetical protein